MPLNLAVKSTIYNTLFQFGNFRVYMNFLFGSYHIKMSRLALPDVFT